MKKLILFLLVVIAFLPEVEASRPGPHPVYVEIRNSNLEIPAAGDITFQAWLVDNPGEILDENTTDCYYPAFDSSVKINCGQFSDWTEEDILHIWVQEISSGEEGEGEYQLNYNASQFFYFEEGDGILLGGNIPPQIDLPEQFNFDEDTLFEENFSQYLSGTYVELLCSAGNNLAVEINGTDVTITPAENWFGSEFLTFTVNGFEGETDEDEVEIVVNAVNDPPVWNLPASFQFNEDDSFSTDISQYASDAEEDPITFSASSSAHITAVLNGTQLILSAEENWNGLEEIALTASDNQRREESTAFIEVIVNPVNDAPVLALPEQITFPAEGEAEIDFANYMDDIDGDVLYLSVYGEDDLSVTFDGSIVSFDYETGWHGSDEMIFTVNDNALRATASDTVTVNIFYPEDTHLYIGNYEIDDGDSFTASLETTEFFEEWSQVNFTLQLNYDPQVLDYTDYELGNSILPGDYIDISEETEGELIISYLHYLPISGWGNLVDLNFTAICYGTSELDFVSCETTNAVLTNLIDGSVTVNDIGLTHPPVADAGDDFGVVSGNEGTLDGSASYDPDGDAITFLWEASPDIIIWQPNAEITDFTAPVVSEDTDYIITLTVSDGENTGTDFVVVTVNYMNHAPEIELPAEFIFNEDETLELDFTEYVSDIDEDDLELSWTSTAPEVIVSISDLEVILSAEENWFGSATLTFTVSDNIQRLTDSDDVLVTVNSVNDPPHADAGMDMNGRDGETITLDGSASWDVETEELVYTWIAPAGIMLDDPYSITPSFTAPQVVDPVEYEFTLQVDDGSETDSDIVNVTIQDDEPALLNIELQENNTVWFTWAAPGTGGSGEELEEGFEGIIPPQGWFNFDEDSDGYGWYIYTQSPHSGSSSIASQSFLPGTGPLTPDNWLITPAILAGGLSELRFWIAAQDQYYPFEHYSVLVSDSGTDPEDFTTILVEETLEDNLWHQHVYSLAAWAGSEIHIAFRHHDVSDQFLIKLDDFQIINADRTERRDLDGYNVYLDDEFQEFVEIRESYFYDVYGEHTAGVSAVYDEGESEIVTIDFAHNAVDPHLPAVTQLKSVYPNPFNPQTTIAFSLREKQNVNINVYNIKGQKTATLIDKQLSAGNHSLIWNAVECPSGIYFLKMQTEDYHKIQKIMLLK